MTDTVRGNPEATARSPVRVGSATIWIVYSFYFAKLFLGKTISSKSYNYAKERTSLHLAVQVCRVHGRIRPAFPHYFVHHIIRAHAS